MCTWTHACSRRITNYNVCTYMNTLSVLLAEIQLIMDRTDAVHYIMVCRWLNHSDIQEVISFFSTCYIRWYTTPVSLLWKTNGPKSWWPKMPTRDSLPYITRHWLLDICWLGLVFSFEYYTPLKTVILFSNTLYICMYTHTSLIMRLAVSVETWSHKERKNPFVYLLQ